MGVSRFSVGNFLSHSAQKIVGEPFGFSENLRYQKILCIRGVLGYYGSPSEKFLFHTSEKFRRGTLLCFRKFLVSKNFMDKKGGRRECHNFPSKICCLTVPENFVGELFCVPENFWYRENLWIRGVEGRGVRIRNRKNIWHNRNSNQGPTASEPCCPNPTTVIYFWIKRVGNFGLKKK